MFESDTHYNSKSASAKVSVNLDLRDVQTMQVYKEEIAEQIGWPVQLIDVNTVTVLPEEKNSGRMLVAGTISNAVLLLHNDFDAQLKPRMDLLVQDPGPSTSSVVVTQLPASFSSPLYTDAPGTSPGRSSFPVWLLVLLLLALAGAVITLMWCLLTKSKSSPRRSHARIPNQEIELELDDEPSQTKGGVFGGLLQRQPVDHADRYAEVSIKEDSQAPEGEPAQTNGTVTLHAEEMSESEDSDDSESDDSQKTYTVGI